jgi:hypothetical protein
LDDFVDVVPDWQLQRPPPRAPWRRWLLIGGVAFALMFTLGIGALLGAQIGTTQAAGLTPSSANGSQIGFNQGSNFQSLANTPGAQGQQGQQGQCETFTVSSVSGQTITAKAANGTTVTIHTTANTKYTRAGQPASASAVTVGSRIHVMGTHNSDGSITATSIDIG